MKAKKNKSGNLLFGITSRVLMIVAASLTLLSIVSMVVNPAKLWVASLLGLLFVPLSIVNLILLVWALKRRSKSFAIPLAALIPAGVFLGLYFRLPLDFKGGDDSGHSSEENVRIVNKERVESDVKSVSNNPVANDKNPRQLKVISYNVGRFLLFDKEQNIKNRRSCIDSICSFIKKESPDIVCLQEVYITKNQTLKQLILDRLKGYNAEYYFFTNEHGAVGNLTLSRFPVLAKGKIKFEQSSNLALYSDYNVGGRKLRVYNCHFESYNISFAGMVKAFFKQDSDVFAETGKKMKRSMSRRPKQVDKVFSHIEQCPLESFVCGDFNDNPMSYTYYRMSRNKRDAFVDAGRWFGATFSLLWPMLRIDYVLYPEKYKADYYNVPHLGYSDHYPVIAGINI